MRKLAALTILILATNAFAFRGRPVSDLRFGGRASVSARWVASDGTNFLVLSGSDQHGRPRTFTQKIADGRPGGPQIQIGLGMPTGLAWTGSEYLAAWSDGGTLWVASVSREGSVTSTPTELALQGGALLVADRNSALAFVFTANKITVQPLDLAGRTVGSARTYDTPASGAAIAAGPAAGGFGVAFSGWNETWLMLFRADGTAMTSSPVLLDGPYGGTTTDYHSNAAVVATDGSDTLVVFGAGKYDDYAELKSAVVGANGIVKSVRVIHTITGTRAGGRTIAPVGLVWDGSQYIAAVTVDRDPARESTNIDPALLRITSNGDRAGELVWLTEDEGWQVAVALGWSGRELLVPMYSASWGSGSFCVSVDPATMRVSAPAGLGRTLATQDDLTIEAGPGGYLAAWFENSDGVFTVRASRVDSAGNYLDGQGVVLGTMAVPWMYEVRTIAIDGNGPQWFVVWSADGSIRGRTVSPRGAVGATLVIGPGNEAAVRWNGTQYVVLRSDGSLYSNSVAADGSALGETKTLAEHEEFSEGTSNGWISYQEPALVLLRGGLLAVYTKDRGACYIGTPGGCGSEITVTGLLLDEPGAAPFNIAENVWGNPAVAASDTQALVTWSQYQRLGGAFLSAEVPEQGGTPFRIDGQGYQSSVAFDGSDFVAAWWMETGLVTARIGAGGTVSDRRVMRLDPAESGRKTVVTASATLPALLGFIDQHSAYDDVSRGVLLFDSEIDDQIDAPPAPVITCATRNADGTITLRWDSVPNVLGISIELQLSDETFRTIGVASSDATMATVTTPGLDGSAVRIRAWNGAGLSAPSAIAPSLPAPEAFLRAPNKACAGEPFEVSAVLIGAPPFTVSWSDGVVQTDVNGYTASRLLTLDRDATLSIVSVTDASCEAGSVYGSTRISVATAPVIDGQTRTVRVARDQTATLSVMTSTKAVSFAWFAGARGDTSHPVGSNSPTFTTPRATGTMQYWARLATNCGSTDSDVMTVALNGRRRAVR